MAEISRRTLALGTAAAAAAAVFPGAAAAKPASPAATAVDVSEYTVGRKVEHSKFGTGVIVSVSGSGNETIAGIEFENLGIKKFVVALAAKNMRLL